MREKLRVGIGYDAHRFANDRPLILGGVNVPHESGLLGHSDADCLVHAIIDALLGAAAEGDIGEHFPDTSDKYKNISSLVLLSMTSELLGNKGYTISNIDSVIIAEKPKLSSFIPQMRENIANALNLDVKCVSVKATTEEGMGFTGDRLGIAAKAVALLQNTEKPIPRLNPQKSLCSPDINH